MNRSLRGVGYLILLLLLFGLAGGVLGEIIGRNFKSLSYLGHYSTIGMTKPLTFNLKLLSLTFGISFNINILSIIGMILGIFIYKKM